MQEEPERLAEIKGISMNIARKISEQYDRKRDMKDAVMYLQKYGITNQMAVKIYNEYKEKMYDVISNNPYKLAEDIRGIGFRMADEIGSRVGIDFNSDFRKKCAINHILSQAGAFGHIYLPDRKSVV